jgi:O-methyltransferase
MNRIENNSLHVDTLSDKYLTLLQESLIGAIHPTQYTSVSRCPWWYPPVRALLRLRHLSIVTIDDSLSYEDGRGRPLSAESMIGRTRMRNLRFCVERIIADRVPGDLIETGVWRGGASIFMRGILAAYGVTDRRVWVADSFEGLPKPDPRYAADAGDPHHTFKSLLAVSLDDVRANFEKYGLLDDQVRFLKGWFRDTLPLAPIERLAVLRLDGDMYGSTIEALEPLYPKLSRGGYLIVDDYALSGARKAVEDYRAANGITDPVNEIDWTGAFWRKS